jgi:hypothetical protein
MCGLHLPWIGAGSGEREVLSPSVLELEEMGGGGLEGKERRGFGGAKDEWGL